MAEFDLVVSQFSRRLSELEEEIKRLKAGSRSTQLGYSSVDLGVGRGYIPFFKDGVEYMRMGRMPDGTVTTKSVNNVTPPSTPDVPIVIPGLGTLTVGVEGLTGDTPFDFSHIRVYVDDMLDGTITRLPGVWVVTGVELDASHKIQVSAVNQSGTESPLSVPVYATPEGVTERDFELDPITETEISDAVITTPKLAANAVEADNVAANAITAASIQAGAVTADKFSALLVIASRFVAGDPVGERLELSTAVLEQYNEDGSLTLSIGASPTSGGNFLTIVDPANPDMALATIDEFGVISASGFTLTGGMTFNGESLASSLEAKPRGLMAVGISPTSPVFSAETGFLELAYDNDSSRAYRVCTSPVYLSATPSYENDGALRLRYTTDGSRPTNASPLAIDCTGSNGVGRIIPAKIDYILYLPAGRVRLLFTMAPFAGALISASPGIAGFTQAWVEDIGPRVTITEAKSTGGGGGSPPPAPVQTFVREYPAIWSRSYNSANVARLYQGNAGFGRGSSHIGFNYGAIQADTAGATILKMELYLHATHWWYNSGGTVVLSTHGHNSFPSYGGFPPVPGGLLDLGPGGVYSVTSFNMAKPDARWITIPNSIGNALRDAVAKGVSLHANSDDRIFYGQFYEAGTPPGQNPALRITYRK